MNASTPIVLSRIRPRRTIEQRFYRIPEVGARIGVPTGTLYYFVEGRRLPVVAFPSPSELPGRRMLRVPATWLDRWLEMNDRSEPVVTAESDVARPDEPFYFNVRQCAETLSVARSTIEALIATGRFVRTVWADDERRDQRVSRMRLDDWCWQLIREAEEEWYGVCAPLVREAAR